MIFFVAPKQETWCMEAYLRQQGGRLARRVRTLNFEQIVSQQELPLGTYIFAAIDQLSPTEKEIGKRCWGVLLGSRAQIRLVNHPGEVLCRYDLLTQCFKLKRNTYRVMRASQFYRWKNYPAFIRSERRHQGSLTRLLHTAGELKTALAKTLLQGHRLRDLMIVEYRDTVDASGMFREYNAAIVGDQIIVQAVVHNPNWVTKWTGRVIDAEKAREEREYVAANPHAQWLRETFELAKIGYGRIDYGVKDGVPQVWEINTNPMIVRPFAWASSAGRPEERRLREELRMRFHAEFQDAFEAIDSPENPARTVRIEISQREHRKLEAEKRWLHRGKRWDPWTDRLE